jgi:hypothetical protein
MQWEVQRCLCVCARLSPASATVQGPSIHACCCACDAQPPPPQLTPRRVCIDYSASISYTALRIAPPDCLSAPPFPPLGSALSPPPPPLLSSAAWFWPLAICAILLLATLVCEAINARFTSELPHSFSQSVFSPAPTASHDGIGVRTVRRRKGHDRVRTMRPRTVRRMRYRPAQTCENAIALAETYGRSSSSSCQTVPSSSCSEALSSSTGGCFVFGGGGGVRDVRRRAGHSGVRRLRSGVMRRL